MIDSSSLESVKNKGLKFKSKLTKQAKYQQLNNHQNLITVIPLNMSLSLLQIKMVKLLKCVHL